LVYLGLGIAAARLMYSIGRGPTEIPGTTSANKPSMLTYAP
jgi:hypothetical protein